MAEGEFEGISSLAAEFEFRGKWSRQRSYSLARQYGVRLIQEVTANASGRPGPNILTGEYVGSFFFEVRDLVADGGVGAGVEAGSTAPQAMRLEYGFVGIDSLGRSYCVDLETEAMTRRGWQRVEALRPDDQILTLNPVSWQSEWQGLSHLWFYPGPHQVSAIDGRTMSIRATENHRWLVERYYGREKRWLVDWRTTSKVPANARIPTAAKCADLPSVPTIEDDVVELAAWFWTEGSYCWGRGGEVRHDRPIALTISQSPRVNSQNCDRIERLLTRLFGAPAPFVEGGHWHQRTNEATGTNVYKLDRVAAWLIERHVQRPGKALEPAFLLALTREQLELLIEVSMKADGHVDRAGVRRLGQADEGRIRSWEMACVLAGIAPHTCYSEPRGSKTWTTTLLRTSYSHAFGSALRTDREHADVESETVNGVWCPTTANGTWLARRHGTVYFTGNSQPPFPHWGPAADKVAPEFEASMVALVDFDVTTFQA